MIKRIAQAYAGLGPKPEDIPGGLSHFHCPHWRNAMTSPVWPLTKTVPARTLARLEDYFRRHPKRRPFDDPRQCYFSALRGRGGHDIRSIAASAKQAGWESGDRATVNVWLKPLALALPRGYSLRYARLGRPPIHKDFLSLTRDSFKRGGRFMRELEAMFRAISR